MIKKHFKVFTLILFLAFIINNSIVLAHSGRTDKYGGHYDRSTGLYHYHNNGYSTSNNQDNSSSTNVSNGSISFDAIISKYQNNIYSTTGGILDSQTLEKAVKTWDRERLESLYIENMNYYQEENLKLETKVSELGTEVNNFKKEISDKDDQIKTNNEKIQSLEVLNKKLHSEIILLIVILVLGITSLLLVYIIRRIKNKNSIS